jgi:hypothetical protein
MSLLEIHVNMHLASRHIKIIYIMTYVKINIMYMAVQSCRLCISLLYTPVSSLFSAYVTGFTIEERGFNFWWWQEIFVPPLGLGPIRPTVPGAGTRCLGVKLPEQKADHSPPLPSYGFMSWCLIWYRNYFAFVTDSNKWDVSRKDTSWHCHYSRHKMSIKIRSSGLLEVLKYLSHYQGSIQRGGGCCRVPVPTPPESKF